MGGGREPGLSWESGAWERFSFSKFEVVGRPEQTPGSAAADLRFGGGVTSRTGGGRLGGLPVHVFALRIHSAVDSIYLHRTTEVGVLP